MCKADYIENLIKAVKEGETVIIPCGNYYIERPVEIKGRKNLTVDFNNSTLTAHFNNGNSSKDTSDFISIKNCEKLTVKNLIMDTDCPVNLTGTVQKINLNKGTYIFKADERYCVRGKEIFMMQNPVTPDGRFDTFESYSFAKDNEKITTRVAGEILCANTYGDNKHEYIGNNEFEVYMKESFLSRLKAGQRVCVRHSSYGPCGIVIKNSKDTVLLNIRIIKIGGMAVVVLPRSENLTVSDFIFEKQPDKEIMAGNCDGIHIAGLCGKLKMENCRFDGLGDDALNIHSVAGSVTEIDVECSRIKCNYQKKFADDLLAEEWCQKGDIIKAYDKENGNVTAVFTVKEFDGEYLTYKSLSGKLKPGDTVHNTAFSSDVHINNCMVKNTRARGFLFGAGNIEVENCEFYGMPSSAILAAPDVKVWYEVGPVNDLLIHNCIFTACAFVDKNKGVIEAAGSHNSFTVNKVPMHNSISVYENKFVDCNGCLVRVTATKTLTVYDNTAQNCGCTVEPFNSAGCQNVFVENNEIL